MHILNLANETLDSIASLAGPDAWHSVSVTCQRLAPLAQRLIFTITPITRPGEIGKLAEFLCRKEHFGKYIRTLEFHGPSWKALAKTAARAQARRDLQEVLLCATMITAITFRNTVIGSDAGFAADLLQYTSDREKTIKFYFGTIPNSFFSKCHQMNITHLTVLSRFKEETFLQLPTTLISLTITNHMLNLTLPPEDFTSLKVIRLASSCHLTHASDFSEGQGQWMKNLPALETTEVSITCRKF